MTSSNRLYPWQHSQWQHLQAYIQQQRLPQALLISGVPGLGKYRLAQHYAAALLCQQPDANGFACDRCDACQLRLAETHPDLITMAPEQAGKAIGIDMIRQLTNKLALKPQYAGQRVVIFNPADALNRASANAFLKCLEEPTERTSFILLSQQPARLMATIRSRCQQLNCGLPDQQQALDWLKAQGVEAAELLLAMAQGAPLPAQRYHQQNALAIRQNLFQNWQAIAEAKANYLDIAEQWQKISEPSLEQVLSWLASWLSDMIKLAHVPQTMALQNPDLKKTLQGWAMRLELPAVYQYYDTVLLSRSQLSTTVNSQLLIENLLIDWSQLTQPHRHG